jgi:hypothetical protein
MGCADGFRLGGAKGIRTGMGVAVPLTRCANRCLLGFSERFYAGARVGMSLLRSATAGRIEGSKRLRAGT